MNYLELINSKNKYLDISKDVLTHLLNIFKKDEIIKKDNESSTFYSKRMKKDTQSIVKEILNKLTESNIHQLVKEFINNIGQITENNFIDIQQLIYEKCIEDTSFIYVYIKFLRILCYVYNYVQSYRIDNFIDITINDIFKNKYENKRQYAMIIYNELYIQTLVTTDLTSKIIEESYDYSDIYYWYKSIDRLPTNYEKTEIAKRIEKSELNKRNSILMEELLI
jgi:predicted transcriptional regulator